MARPAILTPLFRSLRSLKGVGPRFDALLARFFGAPEGQDAILLDVLMHMPVGIVDRRCQSGVADVVVGSIATLKLHIDRHQPPPRGKAQIPHRVFAHDESGEITLVFFRAKGGWVEKSLPVGEVRYVSGEIGIFNGEKQITHPDYVVAEAQLSTLPLVEPVYPLTQGLSAKMLHKIAGEALAVLPKFPEWIEDQRRAEFDWPKFDEALRATHKPSTPEQAALTGLARMRLAYDEYLAGQLALLLVRSQLVSKRGTQRVFNGQITDKLIQALPFEMTKGQKEAVAAIHDDLAAPIRMARLLQGDVGAGKTVVALMAMAAVAESGAQSAMMAPTELLARQHFKTLAPLCEAIGLDCVLVTGKMPAADKRAALAGIADGRTQIVVGTHALFQSSVTFANLGFTVVDEQHRFGVHQRLALSEKGRDSDLLVMTATPIPRTLVLTHFGDMAVSTLREKPAGRQKIETAALPIAAYERVVARLRSRLAEGAQVFWVCPLVEETENLDVVSVETRHGALKAEFGDKVALVHGRMSGAEKQAVMERFQSGEAQILVATTVIEVGVDVPSATIMVIEHAERFGLAQLHQLRGRVGRGDAQSACLLLYKEPLGETAKARLETIRTTEDGFEIAEKDLQLRGEGDVLGVRQSGEPGYTIAVPEVHQHLLEWAHSDAENFLKTNPGLTGVQGDALRNLLYLFRKDTALPLIRAG